MNLRTIVLRLLQLSIASGLLAVLALTAAWAHPPVFVWAKGVLQSEYSMCSAAEFYAGAKQRMRQIELQRLVEQESRVIRVDGGLELWSTPHGQYWAPRGNGKVLAVIVSQQMSGLYHVDGRSARSGDVVIDCGAHLGVYTRQALQDGAAKVIAIEPAPENVECFRRTFGAELESGQVILAPKGVWDRQGVLPLYSDPQNTAADGFVARGAGHKKVADIPLETLDQILEELHVKRVDIVKMDIKGATVRALHGAVNTLEQFKPMVILAAEEDEDEPRALMAALKALRPDYGLRCGPCSIEDGILRPDVLIFGPGLPRRRLPNP